ncbi:MAG: guanylate kinase [Clostridia bacterium]|nr:guanylate kinase [Clostridia bacterium]
MRNVLIVLSGPSGVGKGTIANKLIERNSNLALSVSCTTRNPREGEIDGKHYFFISKEDFKDKVKNDGFLEYSEHFENFYGTPREFVETKLQSKDVLLEIDVNGGLNVKANYPKAILIMIAPPSEEELYARLIGRATESEEKIKLRMSRLNFELSQSDKYDYTVVNDDLQKAIEQIEEIIKYEKNK